MRFLKRFVYVSGGLVVVAVIGLWLTVRASLPQLDGVRTLAGLAAPVVVGRDAIGAVTIRARDRRDAARATGFVHAQERLFQMDLMRRLAAGELAALVGEAAAGHDTARRVHRMRSVARRVMDGANADERAIIEAYAAGVNAGIAALPVRPFEYLILRAHPAPWQAEDTVLVVMAMYFQLHDERASRESRLARLHGVLPPEMYAFLTQAGTPWDAPLRGEAMAGLAVPGPEICDVRRAEGDPRVLTPGPPSPGIHHAAVVGSNAWAVSPRRTRAGVAMVANDMHLGLAIPNTWFRVRLRVGGPDEGVDVTGVTLPGTPAIVAGSNGRVAWGLSNSYGDWVDLVELEVDPDDPGRYLTADGYRRFEEHREIIHIQGAEPRDRLVRGTVWGPVIDGDAGPRALRWLAHDAEATNLALLEMERAADVREALAIARRSGIPPQNLILADSAGNIAWTVAGRMPRRRGYDPLLPGSWTMGGRGWFGFVAPEDYPEIVNPASGALWTANARVVDGEALALIGDGGYALGARAGQIRDSLLALDGASEADMLQIQLDDRALFLAPWRELLLGVMDADAAAGDPRRATLRRAVEAGARRAAVGDAGYRLVRTFRREVAHRVFAALLVGCGNTAAGDFPAGPRQWEGALWRIVQERPMNLLAPAYADWDAFLLAAADAAARTCGDGDLDRCTWGDANRLRIRHPLSRALPVLSRWLDLPAEPMPGDTHMPRVQAPSMGASLRFAVAPGRESSGYFHMPGGQSGHPLSPFYDAGHRAWIEGEAMPFLPGPDKHTLTLEPSG